MSRTTILEILRDKYMGKSVIGELENPRGYGYITIFDGIVNDVMWKVFSNVDDGSSLIFVINGNEYCIDLERCIITTI